MAKIDKINYLYQIFKNQEYELLYINIKKNKQSAILLGRLKQRAYKYSIILRGDKL